MQVRRYDRIIIGAGLYGLYAALFCARNGEKVLVLEADAGPFMRATYVNQARVHQGYHYPRSLSTAMKSAGYFERFSRDYGFCVNRSFDQIYATSSRYSWTDGKQFRDFPHLFSTTAQILFVYHTNLSFPAPYPGPSSL